LEESSKLFPQLRQGRKDLSEGSEKAKHTKVIHIPTEKGSQADSLELKSFQMRRSMALPKSKE